MEGSFQPIVILPTYMGHLLYTPADIHESSNDTTFHGTLDVADMLGKDFGDRPVTEVMKTPSNITSVFSFRSIYGPVVNCDGTGLSVQSRSGRKKVTIENYLERASVDKPSILVALADEIGPNAGHNRRRKAFERTWQWFTKCQQFIQDNAGKQNTKLFAVVMNDSSNPLQLKKLTSSVLDSELTQGIVLGGWYCGEDAESRHKMLTTVREVLADKKLPIMVQGADSLEQIRECLALGVDIIQTSYPLRQMKDGFAFVPTTGCETEAKSDAAKRPRDDDENDDQQSRKRAKVEEEASSFRPPALDDENNDGNQGQSTHEDILPASVAGASAKASVVPDAASINLWNERYRKDLSVLQPGCKCHSCANKYTKSYIHHLLKSRELLADVLLYQHNQHQLKLLFDSIKSTTALDSVFPTV